MRWLAVLVVLLAVPLAFLAWLRVSQEDSLGEIEVSIAPSLMEVTESPSLDPQGVAVGIRWGDTQVVPAPSWSGLVTDVSAGPGDTVDNGDAVVTIDGIPRLAYRSRSPLHRLMRTGDVGADVLTLEYLLNELGWLDEDPDDVYSYATAEAARDFARTQGIIRPDGTFDPAWVVWIGEQPFEIAEVLAKRGYPAPAPGTDLLLGPQRIDSVGITSPNGDELDLTGKRVIVAADQHLRLVGGTIPSDELARLSRLLSSETTELIGTLELLEPREVFILPATAIVADSDGGLCVFVQSGGSYASRIVTLGGGRASTVEILDGLGIGDLVLVNPGDVLEEPRCR
jgi:hypothetical protein